MTKTTAVANAKSWLQNIDITFLSLVNPDFDNIQGLKLRLEFWSGLTAPWATAETAVAAVSKLIKEFPSTEWERALRYTAITQKRCYQVISWEAVEIASQFFSGKISAEEAVAQLQELRGDYHEVSRHIYLRRVNNFVEGVRKGNSGIEWRGLRQCFFGGFIAKWAAAETAVAGLMEAEKLQEVEWSLFVRTVIRANNMHIRAMVRECVNKYVGQELLNSILESL